MSAISRARRVHAAAALAGGAAIVALLTACGSGASPSGASASLTPGGPASPPSHAPGKSSVNSASPASNAVKNQCAASALTAKVDSGQGGAAAGSSYLPIDLTNISSHACALYGFPGVSWVTNIAGDQIGSAATRETSFRPVTVTLAPGSVAHAVIQIADAGNYPSSICQPVTAHWLRIIPPDQYSSIYAKFTTQVCGKKITNGSSPLGILPIRSGAGVSGQAP
ncbi:MAG TPA: DUF4232 domain-containing protein [Streptosporangiaceae bacterium]|nr:DUF4232 domain-containing protein [Streptosporangiaceae bacterium]